MMSSGISELTKKFIHSFSQSISHSFSHLENPMQKDVIEKYPLKERAKLEQMGFTWEKGTWSTPCGAV